MRFAPLAGLLLVTSLPLFAARPPAAKLSVASRALGETRTVLVSLPEGYESTAERYPVLYMTDGKAHLEHTVASLDALAGVLRMPPMIVVAITHADRIRDLTPTHVDEDVIEGAKRTFPTSGGAPKFAAFLADELIPAIDARYRTVPCRLFAGHSLGALLGLHLLLERPALFNAWLLVSPSAYWDKHSILQRAETFGAQTTPATTTVVLMRGDEGDEMERDVARLAAALSKARERGLALHVVSFPEDDHVTVPIPAFYAGVRHFFRPWFFRILDSDDPATLSERIVKHYEELTRRYGFRVAIPKNRLDRINDLRERKKSER